MNPKRAAELLSVDLSVATAESVNTAAAEAIKACHPDHGGDPVEAASKIAKAKTARDVLTHHLAQGHPPGMRECPVCNGKGSLKVRGAFKATECPRCHGEGVIKL